MTESNPVLIALAKALPELESAKKNADSGAFKGKKYANLSAVIEAVKPVKEHGLWYRQVSHQAENGACIETIFIHESGFELSAGKLFVKADKATAQGNGSAVTYARRYSLQTAFGLDAEDDDGEAASAPPPIEKITASQKTELMAHLDALNMPVAEFLEVSKITNLSQLPAEKFVGAKGWITDNAKQRENA